MERVALEWNGASVGDLTVEPQGLYTRFSAVGRLPDEGVWYAWAVGEQGEVKLGVMEPQRGICRTLSRQAAPLGRVLRGELRSSDQQATWQKAPEPGRLFRGPWLRRQLHGAQGALTAQTPGRRLLALPYDPVRPFPLPPLFCLARLAHISGGAYAVYAFDLSGSGEWPVPPP